MGVLGGVAMWFLIAAGIVSGSRLAMSRDREFAVIGTVLACSLVAYALMGAVDQGFFFFRIAFITGTLLGLGEAARRLARTESAPAISAPDTAILAELSRAGPGHTANAGGSERASDRQAVVPTDRGAPATGAQPHVAPGKAALALCAPVPAASTLELLGLNHRGSRSAPARVGLGRRVVPAGAAVPPWLKVPVLAEVSCKRQRIWIWDATHFTPYEWVAYVVVDGGARYWIGRSAGRDQLPVGSR
jgi:hypothetical protein